MSSYGADTPKARAELEALRKRVAELEASNARHQETEAELRLSEERLKILFEHAPDAYYLIDLQGTFIDGNKASEAIAGYKREELIGKRFLDVQILPKKQLPKAVALLARNAIGRGTGPDEFTVNRKDGTQIEVEIRSYPVRIGGRLLVLGIARDITKRKRAEETLREFSRDTLELLEGERRRVGRELHDGVSQTLIAAKFQIEGMLEAAAGGASPELQEARRSVALLDGAIEEISRISQNLRPSVLDDLGLGPAIHSLCDGFRERTDLPVETAISQLAQGMSPELETSIYRILQEALTNVERHADATSARVSLAFEGAEVSLRVADNGRGFALATQEASGMGAGLRSMQERVALMSGTMAIDSAPGEGTELRITIPLQSEEEG